MQDKRSQWAGHIQAWQLGDQSQLAYCRTHGLSVASFGYWRRRLRMDEPARGSTSLVPIQILPGASASGLEVCLRNGVVIRVPGPVEATQLSTLVRALSAC